MTASLQYGHINTITFEMSNNLMQALENIEMSVSLLLQWSLSSICLLTVQLSGKTVWYQNLWLYRAIHDNKNERWEWYFTCPAAFGGPPCTGNTVRST